MSAQSDSIDSSLTDSPSDSFPKANFIRHHHGGLARRFLLLLRRLHREMVPWGYQDEAGFHLGAAPAPQLLRGPITFGKFMNQWRIWQSSS